MAYLSVHVYASTNKWYNFDTAPQYLRAASLNANSGLMMVYM